MRYAISTFSNNYRWGNIIFVEEYSSKVEKKAIFRMSDCNAYFEKFVQRIRQLCELKQSNQFETEYSFDFSP